MLVVLADPDTTASSARVGPDDPIALASLIQQV